MADSTPKSYHTDPALYLYTSLTAGSSHIITATSRLETILKANRIPFTALDVATDEKARMLWGRRAGKRKLPGLVRMGMLIGDLEEIEEWNEYGELKDKVGVKPMAPVTPSAANTPTKANPSASTPSAMSTSDSPSKMPSTSTETPSRQMSSSSSANTDSPMTTALRQAAMEAAKKAGDAKAKAAGRASASSSISKETQEKLDSAGPTGMPPPSGSTDAEVAKEAGSKDDGVESKADEVPMDEVEEKEMLEGVGSNEAEMEAGQDNPTSAEDTTPKDLEAAEAQPTTPTQTTNPPDPDAEA
ncbi:MAG: hypothetical protein Q9174_004345, partial [Haloplaca sp. 1 TL-2023]